MQHYRHRQISLWGLVIFLPIVAILTTVSLADAADRTAALLSAGFGVLVAAFFVLWFAVLTVEVTASEVKLWFGFGIPTRTVPRGDIVSATRVKLPWTYGSGVRWTTGFGLSPSKVRVVTYLAWPGDGVALALRDGKTLQIGSNDAEGLLKALAAR